MTRTELLSAFLLFSVSARWSCQALVVAVIHHMLTKVDELQFDSDPIKRPKADDAYIYIIYMLASATVIFLEVRGLWCWIALQTL